MAQDVPSGSDQRQFPRYSLPEIRVVIDDTECELVDVSPEGVFIGGLDGHFESGQSIEITLKVPLMNLLAPLVIDGVVVRQTDAGLAVHYATPNRTWPRVLKIIDTRKT